MNEEPIILASMNSLAEAHVARGQFDRAAAVLEKLIQREPQNAQHRNKLQFVRSQMGGVDTLPVRGRTAQDVPRPAPPPMEIEETLPSLDSFDSGPSLELDLDESPAIELDLGTSSFEPAPVTAAPPPRMTTPPAPAPEPPAEEDQDLDFITEHLTEAEVFAKYGLSEKATEHLRALIRRAPKHIGAHAS